jgi:hypothetical protein
MKMRGQFKKGKRWFNLQQQLQPLTEHLWAKCLTNNSPPLRLTPVTVKRQRTRRRLCPRTTATLLHDVVSRRQRPGTT